MLVDKQNELMSNLLFTVHQHGGDDVAWKPPYHKSSVIYNIYVTDTFHRHKKGLGLLTANNLRPPEQTENVVYILVASLTQTEGSLARSNSLGAELIFHELWTFVLSLHHRQQQLKRFHHIERNAIKRAFHIHNKLPVIKNINRN